MANIQKMSYSLLKIKIKKINLNKLIIRQYKLNNLN